MVFELVFGFLILVAASYLGTTMALRSFFAGKRYDRNSKTTGNGPPANDDIERTENGQRTDSVPRASDVLAHDERDGTDSPRDDENRR